MSDEARSAVNVLNRLADELRCREKLTTKRLDYFRGNHKLCYASQEFQRYFADRYTEFSDNWTAPVAAAPAERMNVQGIRLDEDLREGDKELSRAWREADCERGSSEAFVTTMAAARSYCLVWADPEDEDVPCVTWERPDQSVVAYDSETRRRAAALKLWADDDHEYATLYTATQVWKFSRPRWTRSGYSISGLIVADDMVHSAVPGSWEPRQGPRDDTWPIANPMGRVPMVELKNQTLLDDDPLSDIDGVMAMQDAINLVWSYLLNALDYASIPQRVVLGTDVPMLPILDSNGVKIGERPLELDTLINEKILWVPGENASISQWPAGNLDAYSQVVERAIEHIAAQTRTPPHYLIGKVANLSAEALTAAETGLVAKTGERIVYVDMAIRDIFGLISLVQGDEKKAAACRGGKVMWADTQFRALAQKVDALLKMRQIGFPFRFLAEEYGLSPLDVERIMAMRASEAEMDPMNQMMNGKPEQGPQPPPTAGPGTDPHSGFYPE